MKPTLRILRLGLLCLAAGGGGVDGLEMPFRQAGWTPQEAAVHLLSRFAYGPRPGDVERVAADPEGWFEAQLAAREAEPVLAARLARLRTLDLPVREFPRRYPNVGRLVRETGEAGTAPSPPVAAAEAGDRDALRTRVLAMARESGYRGLYELLGELRAQKVLRGVYGANQLEEVMTDFWFNHFNVSLDDGQARPYVLAYERDAVRPHALGRFRELLGATARHPAMLFYLDNARSTAAAGVPTTLETRLGASLPRVLAGGAPAAAWAGETGAPGGLNENYARELLELHTLGTAGGSTERDVVEVARAFTGWAALPPEADVERLAALSSSRWAARTGFVLDGAFVFRAGAHDAGAKRVLGHALAGGRGIEDGEDVLDLLARHPATAQRLARKLAVRFVADAPPPALVDHLAAVWAESAGDVRQVLRALVTAPEFWAPETRGAKIKSPLELALSAVRALEAEVARPRDLVDWVRRMGQPLYAYPVPSGFPDDPRHWVNAGALLTRMRFALALAAGAVDGVLVDLDRVRGSRAAEGETAVEALWSELLPGRPLAGGREILGATAGGGEDAFRIATAPAAERVPAERVPGERRRPPRRRHGGARRAAAALPDPLAQAAGMILGSPEFQRR